MPSSSAAGSRPYDPVRSVTPVDMPSRQRHAGARRAFAMTPHPASRSCLTRRTVALVPALVLVLLHAVALSVPPERLHVPGVHDGGDYDSLIQPLVLALSAVSVERVETDGSAAPRPEPPWVSAPSEPGRVPAGRPPSRAPPVT